MRSALENIFSRNLVPKTRFLCQIAKFKSAKISNNKVRFGENSRIKVTGVTVGNFERNYWGTRILLCWRGSNFLSFVGDHNISDRLAKNMGLCHSLWPKYDKLRQVDWREWWLNVSIRLPGKHWEIIFHMYGLQHKWRLDDWHQQFSIYISFNITSLLWSQVSDLLNI